MYIKADSKCTLVRGEVDPSGVCKWFEFDKKFNYDAYNYPTGDDLGSVSKGSSEMNEGLAMFLPLTKVDAVNRLVYGVATEEKPDRSGEIFDYVKSKPYYEKWSADISKASEGKSLGNLRAMHGKTVAGKLTELTFNDKGKSIEICAKVVDDNEWQKVLEGCYTGFSQGGSYVSRVTDPSNPALKRYVASPTEISLVDLPCLPTATFQLIKSQGAVQEAEYRPFKPIADETDVQAAFEKFAQEFGELTLQKHDPGRESMVSDSELPKNSDTSEGDPGKGASSSTPTAPATPSTERVDSMSSSEDKGDGAGNLGIQEGEGNSDDSAGGVKSGMGSGSPGENPGNDDKGSGTPGENPAHKGDSVQQVWLAKDGKPFRKKSDALAHNETLERDALAQELASPAEKAIQELQSALDKVDGGQVQIKDAQAFDKTWQAVISAQSTRAGHQPLGKVYSTVEDLPPAVKTHFTDANKQRQWMHVWNNVFKESGSEQKAFAQAWAAAEKALTQEEFSKKQAGKQPYGPVKYADPGYQKDKKSRYPLDVEKHIRAAWSYIHMPKNAAKYSTNQVASIRGEIEKAWKEKIEAAGPPAASKLIGSEFIKALGSNMSKHLYDVGCVADHILRLHDLKTCLEMEAVREGDSMGMAAELEANIDGLCEFLRHLVVEETEELMMGTEDLTGDPGDDDAAINIFVRSAVGPNATYLANLFQKTFGDNEERLHQEALGRNLKYTKSAGVKLIEALNKVGQKMGQVNRMHLQTAHDHIASIHGGVCDGGMDKAGASVSKETKEHLQKIHDGMSDLGADCSMGKGTLLRSTDEEVGSFEKGLGLGGGALTKIVDENVALKKALSTVLDSVSGLKERILKLEKEPEPAKGFKKIMPGVVIQMNKGQDTGEDVESFVYDGQRGQNALDSYSKYLNTLTEDQRSLEMIKLAQRNPRIQLP